MVDKEAARREYPDIRALEHSTLKVGSKTDIQFIYRISISNLLQQDLTNPTNIVISDYSNKKTVFRTVFFQVRNTRSPC